MARGGYHGAVFQLGETRGAGQAQTIIELDGLAIFLLKERVADQRVGAASGLAIQFTITTNEGQLRSGLPRQTSRVIRLLREHEVDVALFVGVPVDETVGQPILEQRGRRAQDGPPVREGSKARIQGVNRRETRLDLDEINRPAGIGDTGKHGIGALHNFDAVHVVKRQTGTGRKAVHELRTGVAANQNHGLVLHLQSHGTRAPQDIHQLIAGLVRDEFSGNNADIERGILDEPGGARTRDGCARAVTVILRTAHFEGAHHDLGGCARRSSRRRALSA